MALFWKSILADCLKYGRRNTALIAASSASSIMFSRRSRPIWLSCRRGLKWERSRRSCRSELWNNTLIKHDTLALCIVLFLYIQVMQNLKKRLISYIEAISGEHLDLVPEKTLALPLFLRERYSVLSTRLFGQRFLLAVEKEDWETGSPAEYGKHAEALALTLRDRVVLVL